MDDWPKDAVQALKMLLRAAEFTEPVRLAVQDKYGVALSDMRALRVLRDLGEVPICRLAGALQLPRSTMTSLVDRLEERGLLHRKASTADRRVITLKVTRLGLTALEDRTLLRQSLPGRAIAALSREDQRALTALLERVIQYKAEEPIPSDEHVEAQDHKNEAANG